MTDEELAIAYADKIAEEYRDVKSDNGGYVNIKEAYLNGLKAGRKAQWHKVADGDLPEEGVEVLNDSGVKVIRVNGHWRYVYGDEWEDDAHPDYWCEVPEYTEE